MENLRIFFSNKLEILAEKLAEVLSDSPSSPFSQEIIVVQSKGMERWVSMELAKRHGIFANFRFPFPNAFIYELFSNVLGDLPERSPFDPEILTWRIMKLLPSCIDRAGFESLKNYLGEEENDLKLYQLAGRIADVFDQYLVFRPAMISAWQEGQDEHWQAVLWRELARGHEQQHRVALAKAFIRVMKDEKCNLNGLPDRISVFGISALPRFHVELLNALANRIEVNLFLMSPCKEYWGDIKSDREVRKIIFRKSSILVDQGNLHLETGNSLLASMGVMGRDFFDLLAEFSTHEHEYFEAPGEDTLLHCVQSDILNLQERGDGSHPKKLISPDDASIQFHSCHSPMREIEVLYDQLLAMFEKNERLMPKDILVMTPDIEAYAPYIHAVFGTPSEEGIRIPFSIADQGMRRESKLVDIFLVLLDLCKSRFRVTEVLSILELEAARNKFDLTENDLAFVRKWIEEARIHWGIDDVHRRELGLPGYRENTWRAGLERLLLGYALPGEDRNLFDGILPYDQIEGDGSEILGKFVEFTTRLFSILRLLVQPRTLPEWAEGLNELVDQLFEPSQVDQVDLQSIRLVLKELADLSDFTGYEEKVGIDVVVSFLKQQLDARQAGHRFLTGGVTFCAMLPMRSIPCRVICLIGMNGDAYPRQAKTTGFDLIAQNPKPGDRSRRDDDRYLFLESLLSARETFYVSYVGQSLQDNSIIPPSVLVSELMDTIQRGFEISTGAQITSHLLTEHRLQAFNPDYFSPDSERLFSYSPENFRAAQRVMEVREDPVPFLSRGLPEPGEEWKRIDADDLSRFFTNPTKFLLTERLGLYLGDSAEILEESEVFELEGLNRHILAQKVLEETLSGGSLEETYLVAKASGRLPHGTFGKCAFDILAEKIGAFLQKTKPIIEQPIREPLVIGLHIGDFYLTGKVDSVHTDRLVHYRYAKIKGKDLLRIWIRHLLLNSDPENDHPRESILVGLNPHSNKPEWFAYEFKALEDPLGVLENLLKIYWQGLRIPLPFFPESSWEYGRAMQASGKSIEIALRRALKVWEGDDYRKGESADPYYQLCFNDTIPFVEEFQKVSQMIFQPLLECATGRR